MDVDVAGAGFYADYGSAAVNFAGDVVAVERALYNHLAVGVNAAGAGGSV
jgi:hypothetical protein